VRCSLVVVPAVHHDAVADQPGVCLQVAGECRHRVAPVHLKMLCAPQARYQPPSPPVRDGEEEEEVEEEMVDG
jgi:hypothetical protein